MFSTKELFLALIVNRQNLLIVNLVNVYGDLKSVVF